MNVPQLVAHRGYPEHYPENTLVGLEAAVRAGARFLEVDVQLAADEVPVLLHDRTLERTCGVKAAVHHLTAEELREVRASEYERFGYRFAQVGVPTLAEFAAFLQGRPGVSAFVELKRASIEHFGAAVVLNRVLRELEPVIERSILISFSFDVLLAARRQRVPAIGPILHRWSERKHASVREMRPEYIVCDVALLPRWGRLRADNARLVVYEVTDAALALRLAHRGVHLVETFAIGEMTEQIELLRWSS